jgi:hypothetical protein
VKVVNAVGFITTHSNLSSNSHLQMYSVWFKTLKCCRQEKLVTVTFLSRHSGCPKSWHLPQDTACNNVKSRDMNDIV